MKRLAFAAAVLLAAAAVTAQVYEWKDEKGKTHYSDKPPVAGARAQQLSAPPASPASGAAPQKTAAERELDYRKRQKEAQEKAELAQKDQAALAEKKEACESSRRQLETLESGERIAQRDANGERYFLDDAQRQQEATKARQAMQAACKP